MSGVASKLSRISRTRSMSSLPGSGSPLHSAGQPVTRAASVRALHVGSILNPRAPKIRHLNAAHSLLIDLDKHIAKVQELEKTVYELEKQLQEREAQKEASRIQTPLPTIEDNRLKRCLVTEEERQAFQKRLQEAKKKAELLSKKRTEEEANILRSWHSKKLKEVLQNMSVTAAATEESLKLLPAPSEIEADNRIFSCLNALVDIANEDNDTASLNLDHGVEKLKQLVVERENLRQFLDTLTAKLNRASATETACLTSLANIEASRAALSLEILTSHRMVSSLLRHQKSSALWVYGPNPIFSGLREFETATSFQNHFVTEMLKKMDISQIHAEHNLALARSLVTKYTARLTEATDRLANTETAIDAQVEAIDTEKGGERAASPSPAASATPDLKTAGNSVSEAFTAPENRMED